MRKLCVTALLLISVVCRAQDAAGVEAQLKNRLLGQEVVVRGLYVSNQQHYDRDGMLIGDPKPGPWTLDGYLVIQQVSISKGQVNIQGQRISIRFAGSAAAQHPEEIPTIEQVLITVDAPDQSEQAVSKALTKVFLGSSEKLQDIAPPFWQKFFLGSAWKPPEQTPDGKLNKVGGGISPPRLQLDPEPSYTEEAKKANYQGTVVLWGVVGKDGTVQEVQIMRPLGMGLDEKGVEKFKTWRFGPATKDGKPVPVSIAIEINFHLY